MLLASITLQAQTSYTVTNTNDAGAGSLRAAAAGIAAGDTIRFNPNIIAAGSDTITLTTGEIDFGNKGVIIKGLYNATDTMYISGNNNSRIFSFVGAGKVVLDSLVLINGNGVGASIGGGGAMLFFDCTDSISILNTVIRNNTTTSSGGGVNFIFTNLTPLSVTVTNSSISGNTAQDNGGGLHCETFQAADLTVTNSTLSGNTATNASGGGVFFHSLLSSSSITVTNSTLSGNTAQNNGGGLFSLADAAPGSSSSSYVTVTNSTLSKNTAQYNGGGIHSYSQYSSSYVTLANSTLSENTAQNNGGGVYSNASYSPVTNSLMLTNSTISNNTAANSGGGAFLFSSLSSSSLTAGSSIFNNNDISNDGSNIITSNGYNVFTDNPTGATGTGDQVSQTLNLQALAFNGGATKTMLPAAGSVAIDMGDPTDMTDAQNLPISGGRRDVGAAETVCVTASSTHNETVCFGDSIVVNNTVYKAGNLTGAEVFTNVGSGNCDSTVTVTLTIESAIDVTTATTNQTITANQTGATYRWLNCSNGNTVIAGATSANYTATTNGDYAVEITDGNCVDTSACEAITTVGVNENSFGTNISLYPNPTKSNVVIDLGEVKGATVLVTDLTGKEVMLVKYINSNTITLNTSSLNKGLYFVAIQSNNQQKVMKLIRE